ncbi:MAG: hypothetical protein K2M20_04120 [Lachnospiraceae bacterium]|nr:hypothetical protein [Lachnospiraceae bacterium]
MNGKNVRAFLEIIYNCPFILLVIFTGIVFAALSDGSGGWKGEHDIAAIQLLGEGVNASAEEENLPDRDAIMSGKKHNTEEQNG